MPGCCCFLLQSPPVRFLLEVLSELDAVDQRRCGPLSAISLVVWLLAAKRDAPRGAAGAGHDGAGQRVFPHLRASVVVRLWAEACPSAEPCLLLTLNRMLASPPADSCAL